MRELPDPDGEFYSWANQYRVQSKYAWSKEAVLAIQKQAYEDGLRDAPKFPEGWKAEVVSDGDIRLYGPRHMFGVHKETWLIQSGLGGGFYGFLHRMLSAMLTASQKPRCDLCGYQHGHAIGCANNPVDIALKAASQKEQE